MHVSCSEGCCLKYLSDRALLAFVRLYLENVTLGEMEGAGRDVDSFACLDLDAVDALMVVVVIHRVVG